MCQRAFNLAAPSISSSKKEGRSFGAVVVVAFVVTFPIVVILDTVVVALETVVVVLETVVVVVLETVVAGQSVVGTVGCDTPDGDGAPDVAVGARVDGDGGISRGAVFIQEFDHF